MDVSRAKILGRPVQRGNETIIAESRLQVCWERCFLRRGRQRSLPKGYGKSWRDQSRNGYEDVRKSFCCSEREVRDQENRNGRLTLPISHSSPVRRNF